MKKSVFQRASLAFALAGGLFCTVSVVAQPTESSAPVADEKPLDEIVERRTIAQKPTLAYSPLREADVVWERKIWRVIDTREKMNLPFVAPQSSLFQALASAASAGEVRVFDAENDKFTRPLVGEDVENLLSKTDTVVTWDVETGEEIVQIVRNQVNPEDVKRFRVKESWYFDKQRGTVQVRILGIAPLISEFDNEGNFKWEKPLFWVHYPSSRQFLAQQRAYVHGDNLAANTSWEDVFEMRYFSSSIVKENNLYDRRLQDYLSGTEQLKAGDDIQSELLNFEHDLWQF